MSRKISKRLASVFVTLLVLCIAVPAFALSLEEAKQKGLVGEQPDGYLGVVTSSPDAQKIVGEINSKRREMYQEIAKKNGTQVGAVEALAGQKAIEKTSGGQYVKSASGAWTKK